MTKVNPFKPNYPAPPGVFAGRLEELTRLESHLLQTQAGHPSNFMITGERGIGKSSLLMYLRYVATGDIPIQNKSMRFLVIDTDITPATTQLTLIKKIELGLRQALGKEEPARKFLSEAWSFLKSLEAAGVRIHSADEQLPDEMLGEEFAYSLASTVARITRKTTEESASNARYDGLLILIDEADNATPSLHLGSFAKLLMERLQRRGCPHVMLGLAGLTGLRNVLATSHPSSPRLFEEVVLGRLADTEVGWVIERCLEEAKSEFGLEVSVTQEARAMLCSLSEGYPHFIQQFGYSAYAADTDNVIDREDVMRGGFGPRGAMELIGDRYYRDKFYKKIQKDSYRRVLRIMAERLDDWVTKEQIRAKFRGKETVLNNALKALRDRHIILSKEGSPGVYRLQHKGFALWISFYTRDPQEIQQQLMPNGKESAGDATATG